MDVISWGFVDSEKIIQINLSINFVGRLEVNLLMGSILIRYQDVCMDQMSSHYVNIGKKCVLYVC